MKFYIIVCLTFPFCVSLVTLVGLTFDLIIQTNNFRSKTCIFIGYSLYHHGYKCLDLSTGKIYVSRHVIFYENFFPYVNTHTSSSNPLSISLPSNIYVSPPTSFIDLQPSHISTSTDAPCLSPSAGSDNDINSLTTIDQPKVSDLPSALPTNATASTHVSNTHSMTTRSKINIHKPCK